MCTMERFRWKACTDSDFIPDWDRGSKTPAGLFGLRVFKLSKNRIPAECWVLFDRGLRPAGRFRHFSAEKLAGHGVFGRRMSVQKPSMRKTCTMKRLDTGVSPPCGRILTG